MHDFGIIGSGFGGAVAADVLSRAGADVLLLERGPWRRSLPTQSSSLDPALLRPLPQGRHFLSHVLHALHHPKLPTGGVRGHRHGLLEVFAEPGIRAICTSAVGGGSHAYGGLHALPLRADYWDGHAEGLSSAGMAAHYQALLQQWGSAPAPAPEHPLRQGQPVQAWEQTGGPFVPLPAAQEPHWGYLLAGSGKPQPRQVHGLLRQEADFQQEGLFGSPTGGKTTLDVACLLPAMQAAGLQVQAECAVSHIAQRPGGGFVLHYSQGAQSQQVAVRQVLVAAGTLGTVALLLRSQAAGGLPPMPALGQGWVSNGDAMAYFPVRTAGAAHSRHGMYQRIFRHEADGENGPIFLQTGLSGLGAVPMPAALRRWLDRDLFISAMGIDDVPGRLWLDARQRLRMDYARQAQAVFQRVDAHWRSLGALSGQRLYWGQGVATVHPLGGACVGADPQRSVVNGQGQAHQVPSLFVVDGSALPAALGSPPSLSIAAWARHVAQGLRA